MLRKSTPPLTVLLGSGASIPAGMPSIDQLTDTILSGEQIMRHTDGYYYYGSPPSDYFDRIRRRVLGLIRCVDDEIKAYFLDRFARNPNYEDIYFILEQMYNEEAGKSENPIVQRLITDLQPAEQRRIRISVDEARNYILDVVAMSLHCDKYRTAHLNSLFTTIMQFGHVRVFTLNHDNILEQYLSEHAIGYVDGFGPETEGVRYWSPQSRCRQTAAFICANFTDL